MRELIRTNDPVLLSFVESLLREAGIDPLVLDRNMSIMEGSIGILPRRVLVGDEDWSRARHVLQTSGVELDG
jgi:hypothetical protein